MQLWTSAMLGKCRERKKTWGKDWDWGKTSTIIIQGYMRKTTAGTCQLCYVIFTSDPQRVTAEGSEFQSIYLSRFVRKSLYNAFQIKILQIHLPNCLHSLGSGQVCLLIQKDASHMKDSHVSSTYHSNSKCITRCMQQNKELVTCWTMCYTWKFKFVV